MKKLVFTCFALFALMLGTAYTQTLEDVLQKHYKAVGQNALMDKQTYVISATIKQMGMELPMVMKMKRPDKFRMEMEMQGQKMIQVFNGKEGWMLAPWISSEPQPLEGAQLQQAMDQANIDGELYNFKEKGMTADLIGKVKVDDNEAYRIKLTTSDGTIKNYYLDADTYLISKVKSKVNAQGQEVEVEQNMSDYENTEGVMIAKKIETSSPMGTAEITINDISFNEDLDEATFQKP